MTQIIRIFELHESFEHSYYSKVQDMLEFRICNCVTHIEKKTEFIRIVGRIFESIPI